MKYFNILYNSFLWALTLSLVFFTSEWLEMRVNIGFILIALWIVLAIVIAFVYRKRKATIGLGFTIVNFIICFVISMAIYGSQRIMTVPASIIREGVKLTSVSFKTINTILLTWLVVGMIAVIIGQLIKNKRAKR